MDYDRLRELQEKFEENPRRYFAPLANEYRKGGQPRRAIDICRAQLKQMPGHISGQIVYGQALYEVGEFDDARETFERALALDPENLIALRTLGDMSLQSGNSSQARVWYSRLLDADPKDTAVIALVAEIDTSAEGPHVAALEDDPAVESVASAEGTPFSTNEAGTAAEESAAVVEEPAVAAAFDVVPAASEPEAAETALTESEIAEVGFAPETVETSSVSSDAPEGLERHYPVEPAPPPPPPGPADNIAFEGPLGAEGLHSAAEQTEHTGAQGLHGSAPEIVEGAEGLHGSAPEAIEGAQGLHGKTMPDPLAGAEAARSDVEDVVDTWTPPPAVTVPERAKPEKEPAAASGTPEPFVNETMAQLYLQQGYRQLALRVYHQLAEARPNDQSLKDR
ncbi:MAG: tetratricopeptide repeat protein, partial [Gemmatimonadales bacterium]